MSCDISYKTTNNRTETFDSVDAFEQYLKSNPKELLNFLFHSRTFSDQYSSKYGVGDLPPTPLVTKVGDGFKMVLNGSGATNMQENIIVQKYLKAGDPVYIEKLSGEGAGKDTFAVVGYFDHNTKEFRAFSNNDSFYVLSPDGKKPPKLDNVKNLVPNVSRIKLQTNIFSNDTEYGKQVKDSFKKNSNLKRIAFSVKTPPKMFTSDFSIASEKSITVDGVTYRVQYSTNIDQKGTPGYKLQQKNGDTFETINSVPRGVDPMGDLDLVLDMAKEVNENLANRLRRENNMPKLSKDVIPHLLSNMIITGLEFDGRTIRVLRHSKRNGKGINEVLTVQEYVRQVERSRDNKGLPFDRQGLIDIISNEVFLGKVFIVIDDQVLPLQTIRVKDDQMRYEALVKALDKLQGHAVMEKVIKNEKGEDIQTSHDIFDTIKEVIDEEKKALGTEEWNKRASKGKVIFNSEDIFMKRLREGEDMTSLDGNIRGEFITVRKTTNADKKEHGVDKEFYILKYVPKSNPDNLEPAPDSITQKRKNFIPVKEYLTYDEALELLSNIRVNIDHERLAITGIYQQQLDKGKTLTPAQLINLNNLKSNLHNSLRVFASNRAHYAPVYNNVEIADTISEKKPFDFSSTESTKQDTKTSEKTKTSAEAKGKQKKEEENTSNVEIVQDNPPPSDNETNTPSSDTSNEKKGTTSRFVNPNITPEEGIGLGLGDFKISDKDYSGDVKKAVEYIKERFEELDVNVDDTLLSNLVKGTIAEGSKVWGAFHNAMVTLASTAGVKAAKHEAMHVAFKMVLTTEQQINVLNELWELHKDNPKYKDKEEQFKEEIVKLTKNNLDNSKNFKTTAEAFYANLPILDQLQEELSDSFEEYKTGELISRDSNFGTKFPKIAKFLNNLFNFLKDNYYIAKNYVTNKKSIDQLFYELDRNILDRNFLRQRRSNKLNEAINKLSKSEEVSFKVSNWSNTFTIKVADFIVGDLFTNYLHNTYGKVYLNEIFAENKKLKSDNLIKSFKDNVSTIIDQYFNNIVNNKGLEKDSPKYNKLRNLLNDIINQYSSEISNEVFNRIIDKKFEERLASSRGYEGSTYTEIINDVSDIDVVKKEYEEEQETDESEIGDSDTNEIKQLESWQTKSGRIDARTKSSARLREFFSYIPIKLRHLANNSDDIISSKLFPILDNDLYNQRYYKGNQIHNRLLVELSGNHSQEDFISALNNIVYKYQFMGDIIKNILNISEEELLERYDTDSLELPLDILSNPDKYPNAKLWILKDMYRSIGDQTNFDPIKISYETKDGQIKNAQLTSLVTDTDLQNTQDIIKESLELIKKDKEDSKRLISLINSYLQAVEEGKPVTNLIVNIFSELAFDIDANVIVNIRDTVSLDGKSSDAISNLDLFTNSMHSILDYIEGKDSLKTISKSISNLSNLIVHYADIGSGLSYMNVEGENEFAHQNSHYLSRVQNIWNKGEKKLEEWIENQRTIIIDGVKHNIVIHNRLRAYEDLKNFSDIYKLFPDGYTDILGQTSNGKPYADYTTMEMDTSKINLFLSTKNQKSDSKVTFNKGVTQDDVEIGLFTIFVNSDSPKRNILRAPVFSLEDISERLTELIYGELERINLVKNSNELAAAHNISKSGLIIQNIPELNEVKFVIDGNEYNFHDLFNMDTWADFDAITPINNSQGFKEITIRIKDKNFQGGTEYTEGAKLETDNLKDLLKETIERVINNNFEYYANEKINDTFESKLAVDNISFLKDESGKIVLRKKGNKSVAVRDVKGAIKPWYINSMYNDIIAHNMFSGDPGHYKGEKHGLPIVNTELIKRDKQLVSPNNRYAFVRKAYNIIVMADTFIKSEIFPDNKKGMNVSDAGAYHTLDRRLEILQAMPNWDMEKDRLLPIIERIRNGTYTNADLEQIYFPPLKPFVYTQVTKGVKTKERNKFTGEEIEGNAYFRIPIQLKDSEHVLLPTEAYQVNDSDRYVRPETMSDITSGRYKNPALAKLLFLMEGGENQAGPKIDVAVFESASKAEIMSKVDLNDENLTSISEEYVLELNNSDFGEQMNNPRKDLLAHIRYGVQELKEMTTGISDRWSFTLAGKTYKGQAGAKELLFEIVNRDMQENLDNINSRLRDKDGNIKLEKALEIVSESLMDKSDSVESLEGLEVQDDGKTLTPLEMLGKQAEKVLNSFYKKIVEMKGKGATLVNKPGFGYVGDAEGKLTPSDALKVVRINGKITHFEAIVPVYDPVIFRYLDDHGNLLLDKDGKPLIPEKLLSAFFYRIPTEAKYSMYPIKIKKFSMPAEGGSIILPAEATETSGLDFDNDKLYGYFYNLHATTPNIEKFRDYVWENSHGNEKQKELILKKFDAIYQGYDRNKRERLRQGLTEEDFEGINAFGNWLKTLERQFITENKIEKEHLDHRGLLKRGITIDDSTLDNRRGRHNLKLDVYFSIVAEQEFWDQVINKGNKDRLIALRDKLAALSAGRTFSYADPTYSSAAANRNMTGKRLIEIFAHVKSFYSMIQGATTLDIKGKAIPVTIYNEDNSSIKTYNITTIGAKSMQIVRNLAELLFASTEDVKDPVLEPLNINTHTANLLVTLLMMTDANGEHITFEHALQVLQDGSVKQAVAKAENEGKRFDDVYEGKYAEAVKISKELSTIMSGSKVDKELGPDFHTVMSKMSVIDSTIDKAWELKSYPFTFESVISVLPNGEGSSLIPQLNTIRKGLETELSLFSDLFSFLNEDFIRHISSLEKESPKGYLHGSISRKLSYHIYDSVIQHYLEQEGELGYYLTKFSNDLQQYKFPKSAKALQRALRRKFSSYQGQATYSNITEMRTVNISATNLLEQYRTAFSDLFTSDPIMAEKLATYAFLTGTAFGLKNITKIVPKEFYETERGKKIRRIVNGLDTFNYTTPEDLKNSILFNHFDLVYTRVKNPVFTVNQIEINGKLMDIEFLTTENDVDRVNIIDPNNKYLYTKDGNILKLFIRDGKSNNFYRIIEPVNTFYHRNYTLYSRGLELLDSDQNPTSPDLPPTPPPSGKGPISGVRTMEEIQKTPDFIPLNISGNNKKDTYKMSLGNKLIAFGFPGSSTETYAKKAGNMVNTENYSSNDIVNISIVGRRLERHDQLSQEHKEFLRSEFIEATKREILTAIKQGVNHFIADVRGDQQGQTHSSYNIVGEGVIADWFINDLPNLGYEVYYSESDNKYAGFYRVIKKDVQQQQNEGQSSNLSKNVFRTKIDQFEYSYEPKADIVIHHHKNKGDIVETNKTQINKVLVEYGLANNYPVREFNRQKYIKINDKVLNASDGKARGNVVTQKQILDLFLKKEDSFVPQYEGEDNSGVPKSTFTYQGKTIETDFELTDEQDEALKRLIDFSQDNTKSVITLSGYAGTGKTSTIKYLEKHLGFQYNFIYATPTHAANIFLALNIGKLPSTVTSLFNDFRGKPKFTFKMSQLLSFTQHNIIVVDEASMMRNRDIDTFVKLAQDNDIKVIFMGDKAQLPEVTTANAPSKPISKVFTNYSQLLLTEVKRTTDSSILKVLTEIRNNPDGVLPVITNTETLKYLDSILVFKREAFNKLREDGENTIYITYRNKDVQEFNRRTREGLGFKGQLQVGESILGYGGYNSKQIEKGHVSNSVKYTVKKVEKQEGKLIIEASSDLLELINPKLNKVKTAYYQLSPTDSIKIDNITNEQMEKNNKLFSSKFKTLYNLKQEAMRTNKWNSYYTAQGQLAEFLAKADLGDNYVYNYKTDRMELYNSQIHDSYLRDNSDMKVEKGLDYGYAVTVHKAQGATFKHVFFDASTVNPYISKLTENGKVIGTEGNSLLYVGMSRAAETLTVLKGQNIKRISDSFVSPQNNGSNNPNFKPITVPTNTKGDMYIDEEGVVYSVNTRHPLNEIDNINLINAVKLRSKFWLHELVEDGKYALYNENGEYRVFDLDKSGKNYGQELLDSDPIKQSILRKKNINIDTKDNRGPIEPPCQG